jgi:hypothetical protein
MDLKRGYRKRGGGGGEDDADSDGEEERVNKIAKLAENPVL